MRVERLREIDDPRVADYRDAREPQRLAARGRFIVEGRAIVRTLLAHGRFRVRSLLLTERALADLEDLAQGLDDAAPVLVADTPVLRAIVGFPIHRGCLAIGERGTERLLAEVLPPGPAPARVVVLEGVGNPDNVGGIFRNALAFGADAVLLGRGCGDPLYRKAIRVSAGAALRVPFARVPDWPAGLGALSAAGFTLVALVTHAGAVEIADLGARPPAGDRIALVVGAEGTGLTASVEAAADVRAIIRMAPGVDSLNVATAAAIALHRLARPT